MFNKPNLFPKTAEPQAVRSGRQPTGTGSGTSFGESSASARDSGTGSTTGGLPSSAAAAAAAAAAAKQNEKTTDSSLIVGPDVKLKGAEIQDCDTLVVEGRVEATMDSRVIRIAESGAFSGKVGVDVAEIHGRFDGELTARGQLIIHATGKVSGKIRYGKIFIEEGGEISGDIRALDSAEAATTRSDVQPEPAATQSSSSATEVERSSAA
mgnify:CR=1 FL=1